MLLIEAKPDNGSIPFRSTESDKVYNIEESRYQQMV